eukprot:15327355-Ditylum_brightwellii.AAC.1
MTKTMVTGTTTKTYFLLKSLPPPKGRNVCRQEDPTTHPFVAPLLLPHLPHHIPYQYCVYNASMTQGAMLPAADSGTNGFRRCSVAMVGVTEGRLCPAGACKGTCHSVFGLTWLEADSTDSDDDDNDA